MSRCPTFDRSRLELLPVAWRESELLADDCLPLAPPAQPYQHPEFPALVRAIKQARGHGDFCGSHERTIPSLWEGLRP